MVLEQMIRQRSYEIWQREGCPEGKAVEHWLHAMAELEAEQRAASFPWSGTDCREIVVSRLPISPPPLRVTSRRLTRTAA
jgi:Protein of unknown function (DUF2934)